MVEKTVDAAARAGKRPRMPTRRTAGDPNGKSISADASKRLPRTQKGWRTRERLITAAATVINAEGYQASTVENIARKAEVPIGLYYRYFKDKADIAFAVLGKAAEDFRGSLLSLAAQRSLFGREMAVHELLYETIFVWSAAISRRARKTASWSLSSRTKPRSSWRTSTSSSQS